MAAYSFSPLTNIHEATITRAHVGCHHKGIMAHNRGFKALSEYICSDEKNTEELIIQSY